MTNLKINKKLLLNCQMFDIFFYDYYDVVYRISEIITLCDLKSNIATEYNMLIPFVPFLYCFAEYTNRYDRFS